MKVNFWKWSTVFLSICLFIGWGHHLNLMEKRAQEYEKFIAATTYCDGLKYTLLDGQMKRRMYAPFPEEDAQKCKARIPGFDPDIPNYVGQ